MLFYPQHLPPSLTPVWRDYFADADTLNLPQFLQICAPPVLKKLIIIEKELKWWSSGSKLDGLSVDAYWCPKILLGYL